MGTPVSVSNRLVIDEPLLRWSVMDEPGQCVSGVEFGQSIRLKNPKARAAMMRQFRHFNAVGFVVGVVAIGHVFFAPAIVSAEESAPRVTPEALRAIVVRHDFSGVLLVEYQGEMLPIVANGFQDPRTKKPIGPQTRFEIASVTKSITAVAIMRLVEQNKLRLDDPIGDHLEGVPEHAAKIQVQHLLNHTTGMPANHYGQPTDDPIETTASFLRADPRIIPGVRFAYWNQGYCLLAILIEKTHGQPFTKAIDELVFQPCRMDHALLTGQTMPMDQDVAVGTSQFGDSRSAMTPPYGTSYGYEYQGTGGVVCTANDLAKFIRALDGDELLSPEIRKRMLTPYLMDYAMGWHSERVSETQRKIFHGGGVRGFLASLVWYADDQTFYVLLCNDDDPHRFRAVESDVRRLIETPLVRLSPKRKFTKTQMAPLLGTFEGKIPNGRELRIDIALKGTDQVEMKIDWGPGLRGSGAIQRSDNPLEVAYVEKPGVLEVMPLILGDDGKVASFTIFGGNFQRVP